MLRDERLAKILEIIDECEIETQEELCEELNKRNFSVTQATVSRDMKRLHLFKVSGINKKYRYAYMSKNEGVPMSTKVCHLFKDSIVSVKNAGNLVVIRTLSGNAMHIGSILDDLGCEEIVGTLAGNNNLFVACDSAENALKVTEKLEKIIR